MRDKSNENGSSSKHPTEVADLDILYRKVSVTAAMRCCCARAASGTRAWATELALSGVQVAYE